MFRVKTIQPARILLSFLPLLVALLILLALYTRPMRKTLPLFPTPLPEAGTISPILHAQNLSHGSFHNPSTKPYLLSLVTTSPSEDVVIIGLAGGAEAVSMSRTHHVHAVEPMPHYIKRFRNRAKETTKNVTLYPFAASDKNGELKVSYKDMETTVKAKRVEELLPRDLKVAVVSVDVQGAEFQALEGLGSVLERTNSVWVEVGCKYGKDTPRELLQFLDKRFALFDFVPWGRREGVEETFDRRQFLAGRRPDELLKWVRWFCDGREQFKWMQTDVVGISRELLRKQPRILDELRMVGERNCEQGCYYRDAVAA